MPWPNHQQTKGPDLWASVPLRQQEAETLGS